MPIRLRVAELRAAKGWTQEQLAERSGVSRATIIRIENENEPPRRVDFDVLERLAQSFDVEPGFLLAYQPVPARANRRAR